MGIPVLIFGESGTGKSTSMRNLNPEETFIFNVLGKPLPFRSTGFRLFDTEKKVGNVLISADYKNIMKYMKAINDRKPEIKTIIVDDFQYLMATEYMRRALEVGYNKFTEIGLHVWDLVNFSRELRDDLTIFYLSHSDTDINGKIKCKTIGKMLDNVISLEGMFTLILYSTVNDGRYEFLTKNTGNIISKTPVNFFDSLYIENDLQIVKEKLKDYYSDFYEFGSSQLVA